MSVFTNQYKNGEWCDVCFKNKDAHRAFVDDTWLCPTEKTPLPVQPPERDSQGTRVERSLQTNAFLKNDQEKASRPELLSFSFLDEVSKVLAIGAKKYGVDNWRKGTEWRRYIGALLRHVTAFTLGQSIDPDTKCHHLACAACNLQFLFEMDTQKFGVDDRAGRTM